MPRYIDADALAKVLNITEECKDCAYHWGTHNGGFFCGKSSEFTNACEAIFDAPTADVVEVVHGHWLDAKYENINTGEIRQGRRCSECKHGYFRYDVSVNTVSDIPRFCPNCGAKMDEVSK